MEPSQKSLDNQLERNANGLRLVADTGSARERAVDPYRLRAEFPEFWARYLRMHYGRAEVIAVAFDVTFQTGCNWLEGVSRPTGDKMLVEFLRHPERLLAHADTALELAA